MRGFIVEISMIVFMMLVVTAPQTGLAAARPSYPFVVEFEPSSPLSMDEPITMTLRIRPRISTLEVLSGEVRDDTVAIELIGVRGLQALGAKAMTGRFGTDSTYTTSFDVLLPPDDTSSVTVLLRSSVRKMKIQRWFVTTGDTVEYWHGNPREYFYSARPRSEKEPPRHKTVRKTELPNSNTSRFRTEPAPRSEYQLLEMRRIEESPLTDAQVQYFNVGDSLYRRFEGEKEFTLVQKRSMDEILADKQRYLDSIAELPSGTEIRVCLNLRHPKHLEFARQKLGSLGSAESEAYYHQTVTKVQLEKLKAEGISVMYLDLEDVNHKPHPSERSEPSDPQGSTVDPGLPGRERVRLYHETFNGGFDNPWQTWDVNPTCGLDYWGGSYIWPWNSSIWCAGIGGQTDGGPYDCGMNVDLYSYEIFTDGYDSITYHWRLWYQIDQYDELALKYSYDGVVWNTEDVYVGSNGGFVDYQNNVSNTGTLFIWFQFLTYPLPRSGRGAYLDNLEVWGNVNTYPNLTLGQPSGWADRIIVSPDTGTYIDDYVYEGEPIYIDWAILNNGNVGAWGITSHILLDDTVITSRLADYLGHDSIGIWSDIDITTYTTVSEGFHTLRIVLDSFNLIEEIDETDNSWSRDFWVEPATVMFYGYLKYVDLDPPSQIVPMKNIRISMWDEVVLWWDDSLAGGITDDSGYYELGPVDNVDTKSSDKQDIYLKISAVNDACFVTDGVDGDTLYIQTDTWQEVPSGEHYLSITATVTESGPFFVADRMLKCLRWWVDSVGGTVPGQVEVGLSQDFRSSGYDSTNQHIHIESSVYADSGWPDTFDEDLISHEYAHWIEDEFSFFTKNSGGTHYWDEWTGIYSASSEGFADFFAGLVKSDPIQRFYHNDFQDFWWYNLENGTWGINNDTDAYSPNNTGPEFEAGVATLLWDIYDDVDDDFSTPLQYPSYQNPDGVWDSLSDGIDNMMTALLYREVDGQHPDTLGDFWRAWFQSVPLGNRYKMGNIWYEHGDTTKLSCCELRGDFIVNGEIDISDLINLVDYMFTDGNPPSCWAHGNVDGSGPGDDGVPDTADDVDISDLVYLVDYMFTGGPVPPEC